MEGINVEKLASGSYEIIEFTPEEMSSRRFMRCESEDNIYWYELLPSGSMFRMWEDRDLAFERMYQDLEKRDTR
jgi:hypothetical protein